MNKKASFLMVFLLVSSFFAGFLPAVQANAITFSAWASSSPTIDGILLPGEWDSADTRAFDLNGRAGNLHIMNDENFLYFAARIYDPSSAHETVSLEFDNNHNSLGPEHGDDRTYASFLSMAISSGDAFWSATQNRYLGDVDDGGDKRWSQRIAKSEGYFSAEFKVPLYSSDTGHDFSLSYGQRIGFQFAYFDLHYPVGVYPGVYVGNNDETGHGDHSTFGEILVASPLTPNIFSLTVSSAHGSPTPSVGSHSYSSGSSVTASVNSPVTEGITIWTCTGWSGTGSVPSSGSGTSTTFTITQDSSITWHWLARMTPDLIISDFSWEPSSPTVGDSVIFSYSIENQGDVDADAFTTALYIDGERIDISARRPLAAGAIESRSFTYAWTATESSHIIEVVADDLDEIAESDETNNKMRKSLDVQLMDVNAEITLYFVDAGVFRSGDKVSTMVTVENTGNVKWTFYVGFSVQDPKGEWWDAPHSSISLDAGNSGIVTLYWHVEASAPAGSYNARAAIYEGESDGLLTNRLDVKEISSAFEVVVMVSSAEITSFTTSPGIFRPREIISLDFTIKNTGSTDGWIWPLLTVLGPTFISMDTYIQDVPREPVFCNSAASIEASIKWVIPTDAPAGCYSTVLHIYDGDPENSNSRHLDGKSTQRSFVFMIDKDVSFIQIETINAPWGDQRAIFLHISREDVINSGTLTYEVLAAALKTAKIFVGVSIKETPFWLKNIGTGMNLLTALGLSKNVEVIAGGSADILILQMIGQIGYLYEASLLDIGTFVPPVTLTWIPRQYLETPKPYYSQTWFLWSPVSHSYTSVSFQESQHKLYFHIYDPNNHHIGLNYETNETEIEIYGSGYYDFGNGTTMIILPSDVTDFQCVVDAKVAEHPVENFNITIINLKDGQQLSKTFLEETINQKQKQEYSIRILGDGNVVVEEVPFWWVYYIPLMAGIGIAVIIIIAITIFVRRKNRRQSVTQQVRKIPSQRKMLLLRAEKH